MKKILFLLGILFTISCNNHSNKTSQTKQSSLIKAKAHRYASPEWVALQKKKSLEEGNFNSFGNLIDYYGNTPAEEYELLPIAIIMADKYNCDNARLAIYFWFLQMQNQGRTEKQFFNLDKSKQDFILKYLMDGAANKNVGCLVILDGLIKNGLKMEKKKEMEIEDAYKKTTANRRSRCTTLLKSKIYKNKCKNC